MSADENETKGQDYDLDLARTDLAGALHRILQDAPKAAHCVLILGGDFFHADDNNHQTPAHKHPLDVAARMHKVLDTAIDAIKYTVLRLLEHHDRITITVRRGNHDENSHRVLAYALREWLRDNPRAVVDMDPSDVFMFRWGRAAIFAQHGDRLKPVDFALKLSDICRFWSETPHRYAYTGHRHSMAAERIGGLNWERLESFAPADAYGATWANRRGMKLDTYDLKRGRIGTTLDPIERD